MEIENIEIVCGVDDENQMIEGCVDFLDDILSFPLINKLTIVCQTGEVFDVKEIARACSVLRGLSYGFSIRLKNQENDE